MPGFSVDKKAIRELAELLRDNDLSEIEIEEGDRRIRVARKASVEVHSPVASHAPVAVAAPEPAAIPAPIPGAEPIAPGTVTSPMVGTVYVAPEPESRCLRQDRRHGERGPDAPDRRGDEDDEPDPRAGRRHGEGASMVSDGQPVEFGQPLL